MIDVLIPLYTIMYDVTKQTKAAPSSPDNHAVDFIENTII